MARKKPNAAAARKAPTPDQLRAREEMSILSAAWNNFTDEQRAAWCVRARTSRHGGRKARARRRTGRKLFFRANSRRLALKQPSFTGPPQQESICQIPLVQLVITNRAGRVTLMLHVLDGQTDGVMLSSWHPCNAGAMGWEEFVRIGLPPAPVRGVVDITKLYVAKFDVPPVGKKIFIRVKQMKDFSGGVSYITSAIVPTEEEWHSVRETQQTIAKP